MGMSEHDSERVEFSGNISRVDHGLFAYSIFSRNIDTDEAELEIRGLAQTQEEAEHRMEEQGNLYARMIGLGDVRFHIKKAPTH